MSQPLAWKYHGIAPMGRSFNPTFAVGAAWQAEALCFQQGFPKGLHYIFSGPGLPQ
jgi:hypothetical protein